MNCLSSVTWLWSCVIILLGVLGRPLQRLTESVIGPTGIAPLIWVIGSAIAVSFLLHFWRMQGFRRLLYAASILALAALFASQMPLPIERMHLIKYGVLGWLVARDSVRFPSLKRLTVCVVAGLLLAAVDESLQLFIPDRVGDPRDLIFGAVGSCSGGLLRILADFRPT